MSNELLAPSAPSDGLVMAESFVEAVYGDLNDIKHSFFRIGFRLHEAAHLGYYKQLGYTNITELAEDKFGFKQSTTYELIAIYRLAHKDAAPMQIAESYEEFTQSQLRELCRLKMDPVSFMRIVKPTDTVVNIGRAVTFWNKYVTKHSGSPKVINITELLQLDIDTPLEGVRGYLNLKANEAAYYEEHPKTKPQQGQLPGQLAIDLPEQEEPEEEQDSAYAENSEAETSSILRFAPVYELNDDEIINYCLKYATSLKQSKFRIYERFNRNPLKAEFVEFVKSEYGLGSFSAYKFGDENSPYINCDALSRGLVIKRKCGSSNTIELPWMYVAGRISRLIEKDDYLTPEEKVRYLQWKADYDGLIVNEEPAADEPGNSAYAEKLSFKNEKARREWLDNFRDWGVWLEMPQVDMTFYRFDFANGAALIVEVGYWYWAYSATPEAKERISYSIIDEEHPKFDSKGISYTDVITWLTAHAKEI